MTEAAEKLAPLFLKHGYAHFSIYSAAVGVFQQIKAGSYKTSCSRKKRRRANKARQHLQFMLITTDHLDDVLAGLSFLKTASAIDAKRIAIVGHSFGGQVTLLAAENDNMVRAVVTFAAAAGSWERSPELRQRLGAAVERQRLRSC